LGGLFPNLSYPVIEKLDRSLLDVLFEVQRKSPPDRMGDNATKDFILRHVFRIAPELLVNEVELLRALLRLHYKKICIPQMLADRFVLVLKGHTGFDAWPLEKLVSDEKVFFTFLQERWPIFVSKLGPAEQTRENFQEYTFKYPGPDILPFDHQDIKVYIDNLFVEGKLTPVHLPGISVDTDSWIRCGIIETSGDNEEVRSSRLFELVENDLPTIESRYSDWITFALKWAELSSLIHSGFCEEGKSRHREMGDTLNEIFAQWLVAHFASLINLPPANPAMLHHVPRLLERNLEESRDSRVALLVIDGLALDQWVTMRQFLQEQDRSLVMRESSDLCLDSNSNISIPTSNFFRQATALFSLVNQLDQQRRETLETILGRRRSFPS